MQIVSAIKPAYPLPLFLTAKNKILIGILAFIFGAVIYLASNHLVLFTPHYLLLTALDRAIPFVPVTVWIYLTEYILFVSAYLICNNLSNANKYLYSMLALQIVSIVIFICWPTVYPRAAFPLPANSTSLTVQVFNYLRIIDQPTNCMPSLHISSCYLSALLFVNENSKKFWAYFLWATAIGFSTLTTKQHYIVDVLAGFGMALLFYWLFHYYVRYSAST